MFSVYLGIFLGVVLLPFVSPFDDGDFAFASYFQSNMVLQMKPHHSVIWGYGTVGAIVNVSLIQDVHSTKVEVGPDGRGVWFITLNPQPAGGPQQIQGVQDNHGLLNWILLKNVLFGDVWICSGQSNMLFTVSMMFNASEEYRIASKYESIRLMTPAQIQSNESLYDLKALEEDWSIASSESIGGSPKTYFSAVCWMFGRYLYDTLKVPIGLVSSTWGGTPVEAWSSEKALENCGLNFLDPKMKLPHDEADCNANSVYGHKQPPPPQQNSVLWNAMIHPMLNMTIKGVIWYQGEQNANYHQSQYSCSFPSMIDDWRRAWYEGTRGQTQPLFPFGFVQLSTHNVSDDGSFPAIRWHQTADYGFVPNKKMPNTFMAVAMDLPDNESPYGSIHPRDKQDVAARLLVGALNIAYDQNINQQGPIIESAEETGTGQLVLVYPHGQQLRVSKEGSDFTVCCSEKCDILEPASSSNWKRVPILSWTERSITLDVKMACVGAHVHMVRYSWDLEPCLFKKCSVYNTKGLPAPPFATHVNKAFRIV